MSYDDPIRPGDSWEQMMEKARKSPLWVEPPGKWPTVYCPPREYDWYQEQLIKKNFRALRRRGIVYWDPELKVWMDFNDDFSPYKWSGTPKDYTPKLEPKLVPISPRLAQALKKPEQMDLF